MKFRIIISLALVYQVNPWEIYDPPRNSGPRWNYVSPPWTQTSSSSVVFRRPMDAMVDLTNDLGVAILQDYSYSRSNFAFSPYGVASVLVVLYEGARGESARQIHTAVKFPWDRDITRIGFRDIHRHLRSYFSHEGYLSGITLNKEGTALKPEYKRVLRFYGYDVDVEPVETTTRFPHPTTNKMTQVPLVTRTTTTTTTTTIASTTTEPAPTTTTQTTLKTEVTTKGITTTTLPLETESLKPKEEKMTTTTEKVIATWTAEAPTTTSTTTTSIAPMTTSTRKTTATTTTTAATTSTAATATTTQKATEIPTEESSFSDLEESISPENKVEDREDISTEKQITIPNYTEETTESSEEMQYTTAAEEKSEEASENMEPDDSQNTTPKDINIDNGMLIPQPEGVTPLSVHTVDSQQLPLSNSSDTAESRLGADDLIEENEYRNTETTLAATETTTMEAETTQMFEVKKRSPTSDDKNYLWEPKTLDEYLIQKRNDEIEDKTFINTDVQLSIKSLEEYLSLKEAEKKVKNLRHGKNEVSFRPRKTEELLNRKRKQMAHENRPISFQTNLGLRTKKVDRERRTISDFLKIPPVPDLSLQLQNGMFDSHVSRGADLYRTLPRSLFLVDGAVDTPVPVMSYSSIFPHAYIPRLHSTALEFPLDDERYKLLIILPVERRGLRQLMYDLSACPLRQVLESLRPTRVKATVPTFMVEGFVILTPTLQKLGIWDVFDPRRSNLSGMSTDPELYVRNIEQSVTVVIRNYVEILDIQTRTMAARGVEEEFTATHPFLYFVLDTETNVALMAGQILDPLNSRIY